jgi:hypothetical protein
MHSALTRLAVPVLVGLGFIGGAAFYNNRKHPKPLPSVAQEIPAELEATEEENVEDTVSIPNGDEIAYGNAFITIDSNYRYISSNGLPAHETGTFPNKGNPNEMSAQDYSYRVALNPTYIGDSLEAGIPGVSLNGLPLEPGTAETYKGDISWAIEAFDSEGIGGLGIDWSNAHVQPNGAYHYHGVPNGLLELALTDQPGDLIQLAWASDGFPIYYSRSNAYTPSWRVKSGARPDGPGGSYDGTYRQDWEHVSNFGDLDECNGTNINGSYAYFITDSYPYIQRCVNGTPDSTFERFAEGVPSAGQNNQQNIGGGGNPPQEAITACLGKTNGSRCSIQTQLGSLSGSCFIPLGSSDLACAANR